ncbi:MAG TPA: hypothetical protein VLT45_16810 [Kofleriaceae bacterium]|nr:hypothetical protein [Kofleriaceae bacterium]
MPADSNRMHLRCPKDAPGVKHEHLAVDVRLPLAIDALAQVTTALTKCPCGAAMVLATDTKEAG